MTTGEWIAAVSAGISVIAVAVNAYFARRSAASNTQARQRAEEANAHAKRANDIAMGQAENDLRTAISAARARYEDVCVQLEELVDGRRPDELDARDKRRLAPLKKRQDSAIEDLLNVYQNACNKYLDNKIDRDRFHKDYFTEIRMLFEPAENAFGKWLHPEGISRFKALWKVYRQWYDLENRSS